MSGLRLKVAASVAAFAVGLSILGVGRAGDEPTKTPTAKTDPTIPPQNVAVGGKEPAQPPRPAVQSPPLFVVTGGDELVNRVVRREAEFAANVLARRWTGKPLPPLTGNWKIVVKIEPNRTAGSTTFIYGPDKTKPALLSSETQLTGSLEQILRVQLPHEITHCVLAAHFGRPLPRWADEGIALLSEPAKGQTDHDIKCRELCNAGRCIRLKTLLPMNEYPKDLAVLYAQGHSVARFLHARDPKKLLPLLQASFADGWDKALRATYGFADADELEKAWIEWLRKPENVLKVDAKAAGTLAYTVAPPDVLLLAFMPLSDKLPKDGQSLIRPDGTVSLGSAGSAYVAGMTLPQVAEAVRKVLSKTVADVNVTADVTEYNSKTSYVITDFPGTGERVQRLPVTGNETVLDIIAKIGGLAKDGKAKVWIARPTPDGGQEQILPVDWKGISSRGHTRTNYQVLSGDDGVRATPAAPWPRSPASGC